MRDIRKLATARARCPRVTRRGPGGWLDWRGWLVAALALALVGCAGMKRKDQVSRLDQSVSVYAGAIRWGNLDTAAAFAVPRAGRATPVDPARLASLKVTGYSIRINRVNEAGDEAEVTTGFTYYHEDRGTIRQLVQDAIWYFDAERDAWLMDGSLPDFPR